MENRFYSLKEMSGNCLVEDSTRLYHVTHTDGDGVGCATLLNSVVTNYINDSSHEYIYTITLFTEIGKVDDVIEEIVAFEKDHFDKDDTLENATLFVSDHSMSLETWNELRENRIFRSVQMYDHHATNKVGNCYDYDNRMISIVTGGYTSATLLMFQRAEAVKVIQDMKVLEKLRRMATIVSRYDTWQYKLEPSHDWEEVVDDRVYCEDVIATVCRDMGLRNICELLEKVIIDTIYDHFGYPSKVTDYYDIINNKLEKAVANYEKFVTIGTMQLCDKKRTVALYVVSDNTQRVSDAVLTDHGFIDLTICLFPATRSVSLRSRKEDIDVSEIAVSYGGGGHFHASGAKLETDAFMDLLSTYYKWLDNPESYRF